jgi:hypothetical protein
MRAPHGREVVKTLEIFRCARRGTRVSAHPVRMLRGTFENSCGFERQQVKLLFGERFKCPRGVSGLRLLRGAESDISI